MVINAVGTPMMNFILNTFIPAVNAAAAAVGSPFSLLGVNASPGLSLVYMSVPASVTESYSGTIFFQIFPASIGQGRTSTILPLMTTDPLYTTAYTAIGVNTQFANFPGQIAWLSIAGTSTPNILTSSGNYMPTDYLAWPQRYLPNGCFLQVDSVQKTKPFSSIVSYNSLASNNACYIPFNPPGDVFSQAVGVINLAGRLQVPTFILQPADYNNTTLTDNNMFVMDFSDAITDISINFYEPNSNVNLLPDKNTLIELAFISNRYDEGPAGGSME